MNCSFVSNETGWVCTVCDYHFNHKSEKPPHRNCRKQKPIPSSNQSPAILKENERSPEEITRVSQICLSCSDAEIVGIWWDCKHDATGCSSCRRARMGKRR